MSVKSLMLAGASAIAVSLCVAAPALAEDAAETAVQGASAIVAAGQAAAAEAGPRRLQAVTVTAQRREEEAQSIPVAVTAFTTEQLAAAQVNSTLNLVRITPGMIGGNNTGLGSANVYFMRGLGNTESIATFDPPVGTYVDEIYITRQNANNYQLFDVQSLQVLRGPQGTLFGRNTTGGAIVVTNKKPSEDFGYFVEAGIGSFDRRIVRGSVDMPLSDTVLTKFSAYFVEDEGYVDNVVTGEKMNGEEAWGVRGAVEFRLSETLTWNLGADYTTQDKVSVGQWFTQRASRTTTSVGIPNPEYTSRLAIRNGSCDNPINDYLFNRRGNCNVVETTAITSNIEWDAGWATVNFITGYRDLEQRFAIDFFDESNFSGLPLPFGLFAIGNIGEHKTFSQEIKLSGETGNVKWIGGVFYLQEENATEFTDISTRLVPGPGFTTAPNIAADRRLDNETTTAAIYLQGDFTLAEDLTLTVGGRYTTEEKSIEYTRLTRPTPANTSFGAIYAGLPGQPAFVTTASLRAAGIPTSQEVNRFTPRLALAWQAQDNMLLFVSATNGFKSGGWNARDPAASLTRPFGPEKVWSYEAGLKSEWFDRQLRFNATLYSMNVEDLQVVSGFANAAGGITFLTANAADMTAQGIELEVAAQLSDNFEGFANLSLSNGEYDRGATTNGCQLSRLIPGQRYDNAGNIVAAGGRIAQGRGDLANCIGPQDSPVRYPDVQGAVGGTLTIPTPSLGGDFKVSGAVSYTGRHWTDTANNDRDAASGVLLGVTNVPATILLNLGVRYVAANGKWEAALDCSNCGAEYYSTSSLAGVGYPNDPRRINFRVKYTY